MILLVFASKGRDGLILIPSLFFVGLLLRSNEHPQREFPYSLTLNFSWSLRSKRGIKICPLLFSILLLIHTAQFTRLFRSKRIGLLYPCYTPALTLFIVAASNAALVLFLVTHTMRLFFVFRRLAIGIDVCCLRGIQSRMWSLSYYLCSVRAILRPFRRYLIPTFLPITTYTILFLPIWQQNELSRTISIQKLAYFQKKSYLCSQFMK